MDYNRNAKYFKPKPSIKTMAIILVVGLVTASFTMGIGLIIAIAIIVMLCVGRPADQEIDKMAAELAGGLQQRALDKLGLDEDQVKQAAPISFWGWSFGKSKLNDDANNKAHDIVGKDQVRRSPIIDITWLFFTATEIQVYVKTCSLVSALTQEYTESHFYKTIVSVKTQSREVQLVDRRTGLELPNQKAKIETFVLRNTGGEDICMSVQDTILAENSVKAMRNLLREKQA
jgi:hypothetical protein